MTDDHAPTRSSEPCNCEQALALQAENARLREALAALLAQSGDPNAVTGEFDTAAGRARRLLQPDKAIDYAWPQDAEGLLAMAREWGGVDGDDLLAADVLIRKLANVLADAQQSLETVKGERDRAQVLLADANRDYQLRLEATERLKGERDEMREVLTASRDVLASFQKQAGYLPGQQAYSTRMTQGEMDLSRAVTAITNILSNNTKG